MVGPRGFSPHTKEQCFQPAKEVMMGVKELPADISMSIAVPDEREINGIRVEKRER